MKQYEYLIAGSGLFGATFAWRGNGTEYNAFAPISVTKICSHKTNNTYNYLQRINL